MQSFHFARRYLFSKKSRNAINVITLITATGFAVCTAAMVIILSALNGFVSLVISLYSTFDPDIRITPSHGKVMHASTDTMQSVRTMEGVLFFNEVLEENVLLKYNDKQAIGTIKAVSDGFVQVTRLDTMLQQGQMILDDSSEYCTLGSGITAKLDVNINNEFTPVTVFVPRREQFDVLNPESSFNSRPFQPSGMFAIQQEIDDKYILVAIKPARALLDYTDEASSIDIWVKPGTDISKLCRNISAKTGPAFDVKDRTAQHASLYKLMKMEKWVAFLILAFVLLIVSFNLVGALLMIVIEKKKDFSILNALGMPVRTIRNIIIAEGFLISGIGSVFGMIIGTALCLLQQHYGFIKLGGQGATFVVDSYPVKVDWFDVMITFVVALVIGYLASLYPSATAKKIEVVKGE
jgi:lipoprotein-releasing system permease protein